MMPSMRLSRDVVDDLTLTDDYATEKLRLEMSPPRSDDNGVTRLRPPPPPSGVTAADQYHLPALGGHVCPYSGGARAADTVDLVAGVSTPIYCPSSRRLAPAGVHSTEYVFSAPYSRAQSSTCGGLLHQLAGDPRPPSRSGKPYPSPCLGAVVPASAAAGLTESKLGLELGGSVAAMDHAQRRGLVSFGSAAST